MTTTLIDLKPLFAIHIPQIYDTKTRRLRYNESNPRAPHFVLRNLRGLHPLQLELYSGNRRGISEKVIITDVKVNKPEKHTDTGNLPVFAQIRLPLRYVPLTLAE